MEKLIIDGTQYTIEFGGPDVNRWQKYGKDRLYLRKGEAIDLQSEDSLQASHSNVKNGMWQCDPIVENHKLVGRRTWHGNSFVEVRWSAVVEEAVVASEEKEEENVNNTEFHPWTYAEHDPEAALEFDQANVAALVDDGVITEADLADMREELIPTAQEALSHASKAR